MIGFKRGFKSLLFINGMHLLAKYVGILLSTTSKDSNEGLFYIGLTIIDEGTDESLIWFLATLGEMLYGEDGYNKVITLLSDRSKSLLNTVAKVFPSTPHGFYLSHLETNFMRINARLGKALREEC